METNLYKTSRKQDLEGKFQLKLVDTEHILDFSVKKQTRC